MSRLKSQKTCDFNGFTDLIYNLLKAAWGKDWGTFTEAFSIGREPDDVKLPMITFKMIGKTPGLVGRETREIKPRFREYHLPDETGEDIAYIDFAQVFDYDIAFQTWAPTHQEARELADRFEDFMFTYTGFLMEQGVRRLLFDSMRDIQSSDKWRDDIIGHNLLYLVQLEKHVLVPSSVIKEVIGTVTPVTDLSTGEALSNNDKTSFTI